MEVVGVIGAGVMGRSAAAKILDAGHRLVVYDVDPDAGQKIGKPGIEIVSSPEQVAEKCDTVLMFLPGPREVEACVAGPRGLLEARRPCSVIADMSTVDPEVTCRMAEKAGAAGIGYLDAPVLGRPSSVGSWSLPVGGAAEYLDRCRPVLALLAGKIFHIGPSGAGNRIKLLNQLMFGAINAMTAEMMAIADGMGISPRILYETITASQAATVSGLFKELGRRIVEDDYADPTFTVDLLVKDVRLAVRMAGDQNFPPVLGRSVELINEIAQAQGYGNRDTAIMWKIFQKIWDREPFTNRQ